MASRIRIAARSRRRVIPDATIASLDGGRLCPQNHV
jgi:hypothetical protein